MCSAFVVDLLNFSFWPDDSLSADGRRVASTAYAVERGGVRQVGYYALCAALDRALKVFSLHSALNCLPCPHTAFYTYTVSLVIAFHITWHLASHRIASVHLSSLTSSQDDGVPFLSAEWMSHATAEEVARALRSDSSAPIPLLAERVRGLNLAGSVLLDVRAACFPLIRIRIRCVIMCSTLLHSCFHTRTIA